MSIQILSPGPMTTVQDLGRFGGMRLGFSQGGAMDRVSLLTANRLLLNNDSEGCLEMTFSGVRAVFDADCVIALTGADMDWKINGEDVSRCRALEIHAGDELSGSAAKNGFRAYLGVAGGFDIKPFMGSYSTNIKCGVGGFEGRRLKANDVLPLRMERSALLYRYNRRCEPEEYPDAFTLRVVPGPQDDYFTEDGMRAFLSGEYTVTKEADRMGVRLDGPQIEAKDGVDIVSDGIAFGAVQIPASGKPIIMAADRQTVGGYAKIATVAGADMSLLAQAKPGARVRFAAVTQQEAERAYRRMMRRLDELEYNFMR